MQGHSNCGAYFVYRVLDWISREMGISLRGGRMIVPEQFADDW
jgi:hypothetical protein